MPAHWVAVSHCHVATVIFRISFVCDFFSVSFSHFVCDISACNVPTSAGVSSKYKEFIIKTYEQHIRNWPSHRFYYTVKLLHCFILLMVWCANVNSDESCIACCGTVYSVDDATVATRARSTLVTSCWTRSFCQIFYYNILMWIEAICVLLFWYEFSCLDIGCRLLGNFRWIK